MRSSYWSSDVCLPIFGVSMVLFALLKLQPWFQRLAAPPRMIPLGGVIMGFMGGLTGQQGAFRSMFLLKSGLDARHFIATGVILAIMVDLSRLPGDRKSTRLNSSH